jgi:hypothetical protein
MIAVVLVATGVAIVAFVLVAIAAMRLIRDRERTFESDKAQCSYGKKPQ